MIRASFWLKTAVCSFLCVLFVFGIFGFDNNSKIKNSVIKNTDAAETTLSCKGPADVILVIDRSATMVNYNRFNIAKTASINFIDKLFMALPDSIYGEYAYHQIGLVAFHNLIDNEGLNKSGDYIKGVINDSNGILGSAYPVGYRRTSLAISTAKNSLNPDLSSTNPSATKTMVVITDGSPYYDINLAKANADSAKSAGIRIISVGLKLDSIPDEPERTEAEKIEAEEFIKYIASAPFDCYYASDSGGVLAGCNSVSADNLADALDGVYSSITAAICDEDPPTVIISREPSGTLYNVDNLIITSTARDDIGFNSHLIRWSDNWSNPEDIQNIECEDLAGTEIECSTGNLGPFSSSTNINYRSSVTDANDNEASIEEPDPRSVTVANVTLTIPTLLRNKDNVIKAVVSNYGGNDAISISIDAPVLTGIEIDKVAMTCSTSGSTRTCIYTFNPGCNWTDGITSGFANNINVNIYFYAQSDDVGIRQIASSEDNLLTSNFEGGSWTGTCTDNLNNDCDYKDNDPLKPIIDLNPDGLDEALCDITNPSVGISRDPAGDVYDLESDGITPMTVNFESIAGDPNGIKQHIIYYKIDSGSLQIAFDCNDANADSLCDEDISQNVNNISATVGPFNAGENVEYYSTAIDYSGNNNTTSTLPENFIVKNRECEGVIDLGDCLVTSGGKCCGGVCNTPVVNLGIDDEPYDLDCAKESCEGIVWKLVANFDPSVDNQPCSDTETGNASGCFAVTPDPIILPSTIPVPYSSDGCEIRDYICGAGYCNYTISNSRRIDECRINSLIFDDFECVTPQICDSINNWEDALCDTSISYTSLIAEDNIGVSILTQTEVSDSKTPVTLDVSMQDDESGIASCNLKWRKNGGTIQNINCLQGGVPCPTGEGCNYSEVIGPFVDRDFVEYSVTITDGNDNIANVPLSGWYSFTTRDECYYISDNYSSKFNIDNLTDCSFGSGECCGGHCDLTRTESSVYDDECTVDACSGESWIESNANENNDEDLINNIRACGITTPCSSYCSFGNYTGCLNGGNICSLGQCIVDPLNSLYPPECSGSTLTTYACSPDSSGSCLVDNVKECSAIGDYDNDSASGGTACNCDCNGYDREEKVYSSLSFDGVDDRIDTKNFMSSGITAFTLQAWVIKTATKDARIVYKNNIGNTGHPVFGLASGSDNKIRCRLRISDGSGTDFSVSSIPLNTWTFVTCTYDGSNVRVYKNGVEVGSVPETGTLAATNDIIVIGQNEAGAKVDRHWPGFIDEVRIYNRALYPEEVEDQYNGIFADDTGLVGHWDFDEGTGEIASDSSGNGNDGTLSNVDGKLYNMDSSDWVSGKYGNGLDFDGSNDYVEISGNLGDPSSMSLEFWFYVSESDKTRTQYLLEGRSLSVPSNWWFLQSYDPSGTGNINFYGKVKIDTSKWYAGKWNHLVLTTNSANSKIYINGEIKGTGAGYDPKFVDSMRIGTRYTNSSYFRGKFDEVRIYNRALSDIEIEEHYKGIFADNSGLVGYWDFNEGSGTIAYDSSENGPQWVKYGNGDDEDEDGNIINVLNRNVPTPWQVCTDNKDNDCDGDLNDYDEGNVTGASDCDGEVDQVLFTATAMNRACVTDETCVEGSDLFPVGNVITVDDVDIERVENDFTIGTFATDEFLIYETMIEWSTDNWANKSSKVCEDTGICEVCVEGGTCGEDNDNILSSSLSAGNIFSFRVCAWDNGINRNQKCTDYYNIVIENSNAAPEVTSLSIRDHNFCADGLEYVLEWTFSDPDGDAQASYEIQIKEGDNDFTSGLIVDVKKNLSSSYYQILSGDFEDGKEIEYGNKIYYWKLRVTDSRGGGYERTSEWVEYNDPSDSDGDGNNATFTTPMYNYPQVDFSAISDSGIDCLYATGYEYVGTENRCNFGENIIFSDESLYANCDSPDDKQCVSLDAVNCDVDEGRCIPCLIDDDCFKFNSGVVSYFCNVGSGICEASGSCVSDNDCIAADAARCDIDVDTGIGLCAGCDDDSQCSNEKFETTDVDYFCNSDGVCDDRNRREWYFYGSDIGDPDSINPNPINNYIESESKTYGVIFKVKDIVGNSCYKIKNVLLGGRDYPKWNESAVSN